MATKAKEIKNTQDDIDDNNDYHESDDSRNTIEREVETEKLFEYQEEEAHEYWYNEDHQITDEEHYHNQIEYNHNSNDK